MKWNDSCILLFLSLCVCISMKSHSKWIEAAEAGSRKKTAKSLSTSSIKIVSTKMPAEYLCRFFWVNQLQQHIACSMNVGKESMANVCVFFHSSGNMSAFARIFFSFITCNWWNPKPQNSKLSSQKWVQKYITKAHALKTWKQHFMNKSVWERENEPKKKCISNYNRPTSKQ